MKQIDRKHRDIEELKKKINQFDLIDIDRKV